MHDYCHRCGGELPPQEGESSFCPHCGAPQLYFTEPEQDESAGETTGAPPPPRPKEIEWKTAIRCAFAVGFIAALLSLASTRVPVLSPLSSLWTISASLIVLGFYQKSRPQAFMDVRIGARIGLVTGIVLISFLAVALAGAGLVARYSLHAMAGFDAELTHEIHAQIDRTLAANPQPPEVVGYLNSPEFRAGMMLLGFAMVGGVLVVLSTVGGALGGMLRRRAA